MTLQSIELYFLFDAVRTSQVLLAGIDSQTGHDYKTRAAALDDIESNAVSTKLKMRC
jgi:hypothetical protein